MQIANKSKLAASINYSLQYLPLDRVLEKDLEEVYKDIFEEWKKYALQETDGGYLYYDKKLHEETLVTEELYKYCQERFRLSLENKIEKLKILSKKRKEEKIETHKNNVISVNFTK